MLTIGCDSSSGNSPAKPTSAAPTVSTQEIPPAPPSPAANTVTVRIRAVDMDGKPVPNMLPVATKHPNAFDAPVAKGDLTSADGSGVIAIPNNEWLFVRAWDPAKQIFANNYFDVLPGNAAPKEVLTIVMLPGATFTVELLDVDSAPVANQFVGIMMSHPTRGPWWPAESQTDAQGFATFTSVPPGKYVITLETRDGRHVDLPETTLLPTQTTKAGPAILR